MTTTQLNLGFWAFRNRKTSHTITITTSPKAMVIAILIALLIIYAFPPAA